MSETMEVWSIRDAEQPGKAYWKHIGRAWRNRDGSISVTLDALPLGDKIQIRKAKDRPDD